jgi:hypothetical protein
MSAPTSGHRLHGDAPLAKTARTILKYRLDELVETRASISGPSNSEVLHALRISAKRLRYSLEMFAVCFPEKLAQERADGVREMQDVLGRIHDLDVLHGLLEERITGIDVATRADAMRTAMSPGDEGQRIDQLLARLQADGKSDGRLGLYRMVAAKAEERRRLYDQFVALWTHWEEAGFLAGIQASISDQYAGNPVPIPATQGG